MNLNTIHNIDALEGLRQMPDQSVNCCVTSPPYWGLRDYGVDGQMGLEETPEEYIERMVELFREVKRVLRDDGTLWLNIGDSYAGSGKGSATHPEKNKNWKQGTNKGTHKKTIHFFHTSYYKPKDLIGIPWMLAFALRADGWYLRQDIIWSKPNPMPESVSDRCTKAHEYIFLLSKSKKYYYDQDAIREPVKDATVRRLIQDIENQKGSDRVPGKTNGTMKAVFPGRKPRKGVDTKGGNQGSKNGIPAVSQKKYGLNGSGFKNHNNYLREDGELLHMSMANKKSVWTVTTKPFKEAHFATFPPELITDCIKAGCPAGGVVLDPFMGSGTTAIVSHKLGRNYYGLELNPEYIQIAEKRIHNELGIMKEVIHK